MHRGPSSLACTTYQPPNEELTERESKLSDLTSGVVGVTARRRVRKQVQINEGTRSKLIIGMPVAPLREVNCQPIVVKMVFLMEVVDAHVVN